MSQDAEKDSAQAAHSRDLDDHSARKLVENACIRWQSDLTAFLVGVLRNRHLAEDAFQKMVIKAIEAAESAHQQTLKGWLFRIALNEARQIQRQLQRDAVHYGRLAAQGTSEYAEMVGEKGLLNDETVQIIHKSLKRLPAEQQNVIRRRIYYGQTFAEIAAELELPLGTVLTWMRRGLIRLREDSGLKSLLEDDVI